MTTIPLGAEAYKRAYAGEAEIILQNRYFEKNPTNLVEGSALITRPGSDRLVQCAGGTIRGNFSKQGLFNGDLFIVSGHALYRIDVVTNVATQIAGTLAGDGWVYMAWMKNIGYEYLFVSDGATLQYYTTGGALAAVTGMGGGELSKALAAVSGYVLAAVAGTDKFYFIQPGAVVIDPLDFASAESSPDVILDMLAVGDSVLIIGNGSAESWYATGDQLTPFAPTQGRVYQRGAIEGTAANVGDDVCLVADDGKVYLLGIKGGLYGAHPISTGGIEERIRIQLRIEQGLAP